MITLVLVIVKGPVTLKSFYETFTLMITTVGEGDSVCSFESLMCTVICIVLLAVLISITYLVILNIYLMKENLTTWELFSWHKISYLNQFERELKSPFSNGTSQNLIDYWNTSYAGVKNWKAYDQV